MAFGITPNRWGYAGSVGAGVSTGNIRMGKNAHFSRVCRDFLNQRPGFEGERSPTHLKIRREMPKPHFGSQVMHTAVCRRPASGLRADRWMGMPDGGRYPHRRDRWGRSGKVCPGPAPQARRDRR
uniref:Uncharacterized protein n=1 Tax=Hydrogenophaga sp. PL2G6 TaxID=503997 RepID=B4Y352_9BURK|nr:hypothetical protein [Hydrogenophaga sp. PL2G6]